MGEGDKLVISVVIPVYNEERALPATLDRLLGLEGHREIIAVDGGSTDRTLDLLGSFPQLRTISAPKGRAAQMNAGAKLATGEWLLFLHADTLLPEGALQRLNALEPDSTCLAGGFRHRFSGNRWGLRLVSALDNWRCGRTRIIYGDQALFVRRALFEHLGGFPDQAILEDLAFGDRLLEHTQPRLLDDYVVTDSRKFEQMGVWRSLMRVLLIIACYQLRLPVRGQGFFSDIR
jgi:rSAM/selenodomain-associated transferase 2